jgi:phosphohistidine phosphatase
MKVFIVRHAIAYERNRSKWPDDSRRPLTQEGTRKFRKAARGLSGLLPGRAVILTSPWRRARDTAAMLAAAAKLGPAIECPELAGDASTREVFTLLRSRKDDSVVLVGHEPNLGNFIAAALAGGKRARLKIDFKKGGAACVEFPARIGPGRATLAWMLPPRVLRGLGR